MKLTGRLAVLCSVIILSGAPLHGQAPAVLEAKANSATGSPPWISAEAVADEGEIIDLNLIDSDYLRGNVEKQRQSLGVTIPPGKAGAVEKPTIAIIPPSECRTAVLSTSHGEDEKPGSTLSDLVTYSRSILRGTLRAVEPGFAFGLPSSLLEVEVAEGVKGPVPTSPLYVSYPIAHFRIGPLHFCNGNKGFEPRPGDEILLFAYKEAVDRAETLYTPRLDQLFFQSQSGTLILPPNLRNSPSLEGVRTLDDVIGLLRRAGASSDDQGNAQ